MNTRCDHIREEKRSAGVEPDASFLCGEESNARGDLLVRGPAFGRFCFAWFHQPSHEGVLRTRRRLSADITFQLVFRNDAVAFQAAGVAIWHGSLKTKKFYLSMEQMYQPGLCLSF